MGSVCIRWLSNDETVTGCLIQHKYNKSRKAVILRDSGFLLCTKSNAPTYSNIDSPFLIYYRSGGNVYAGTLL